MARCMALLGLVCLASSATALSSVSYNRRNFLSVSMQPELVARTLSTVEQEWKDQAGQFIQCELQESKEDCQSTPENFHKSCETVVGAIVQASNGETEVTKEYMVDICSQGSLTAWRRDTCIALARDVTMKMTVSSYENRVNFKADKVCTNFWAHFLSEQKVLHQKEMDAIKAENEAKKKRAEEEAARKAQQEKEEAERQRKEELAKEVERKQKEAELSRMRDLVKRSEAEAKKKDQQKLKHEEAEVNSLEEKAEEEIQSADQAEKGTESSIKEAEVFEKEEEAEVKKANALKAKAQKKEQVKAAPVKAAPAKTASKAVKKTSKDATLQRAYDVLAAAEKAAGSVKTPEVKKTVKTPEAKKTVTKATAPSKAAPKKAVAKAAPVAQKDSKATAKKA